MQHNSCHCIIQFIGIDSVELETVQALYMQGEKKVSNDMGRAGSEKRPKIGNQRATKGFLDGFDVLHLAEGK